MNPRVGTTHTMCWTPVSSATVAVTDDVLMAACRELAAREGIFAAPEGGAGLAAIDVLVGQGKIARDERVVLFNTGAGHKYVEAWQAALVDAP